MNKKCLIPFLINWSIKINLPFHLIIAYLPGFLLFAAFIQSSIGSISYIILMLVELWEIRELYAFDDKLSEYLMPMLIMHPYLSIVNKTANWLYHGLCPNSRIQISDGMILNARMIYTAIVFTCIIISKVRKSSTSHKLH